MAAEPTLGEISGGRIDPEIATGQPAVINDDSQLLRSINENAQFKAQNDWNKYRQFLNDYETRLKNQQEIADKEVSEGDREYLKKRSIELFKDVASDPYKIYNPEFNSKLSQLRADATASKQDRDFAEKNMEFMMAHPDEWGTDENKQMVRDYLNNQSIEKGGRKPFLLNQADNVDYMAYFNALKEGTKTNRVENILDANGVMYNREYSRYDKDKFLEKVKLSYDSNPKIQTKANRDYNSLPPEVKGRFKDAGDYWNQFGAKHFLAGEDEEKLVSEKLGATPNYLDKEKLGLEERKFKHQVQHDKDMLALQRDILNFNKTKPANTPAANAPIAINYWEKKILPQLGNIKIIKDRKGWRTGDDILDVPNDFTGDVPAKADQIAGLDVAVFGQLDDNDNPVAITGRTKISVRYKDGKPVGLVIGGQLHDANSINSKAFQMHDKYVNNKLDISPFAEFGGTAPVATPATTTGGRKYKGLDPTTGKPIFE